jgi:hypothetical protein
VNAAGLEAPKRDQRGRKRERRADIGAYELVKQAKKRKGKRKRR